MTLEPIVHELSLRCAPAIAFDAGARIGEWWDPDYTSDASTLETVVIEPRQGGRVFERHRDGHEVDLGRVTVWERPHRLVQGCSARFEHGGWTAENAEQRAKFRDWPVLLRRFSGLAES